MVWMFRGSRTTGNIILVLNGFGCFAGRVRPGTTNWSINQSVKLLSSRGPRTTGDACFMYSYVLLDVSRVAYDREPLICCHLAGRVRPEMHVFVYSYVVLDVSRVAYDREHDVEIHHFAGRVRPEMQCV